VTRLSIATSRAEGRLEALALDFDIGVNVVVCDDAEVRARLAEMLTGLRRARAGSVRLDQTSLESSAQARARVSSVLREEALPEARDVAAALRRAFALRGVVAEPEACLAAFGLEGLLGVSPTSLDGQELRAVAFAIAMSCGDVAQALVLYDPFALTPLVPSRVVLESCRRFARERVVVALVPELSEALRLGGHCSLIERGRITAYGALAAGPPVVVRARSAHAAELAALLKAQGTAQHVESSGRELRITCADPVALSQTLVSTALEHQLDISGLALPDLALSSQLALRARREGR
jgi:ABC-type molybdate transport system ATPase subunit